MPPCGDWDNPLKSLPARARDSSFDLGCFDSNAKSVRWILDRLSYETLFHDLTAGLIGFWAINIR
jgi:hypothetical protein